jgi:hypothetical protein
LRVPWRRGEEVWDRSTRITELRKESLVHERSREFEAEDGRRSVSLFTFVRESKP